MTADYTERFKRIIRDHRKDRLVPFGLVLALGVVVALAFGTQSVWMKVSAFAVFTWILWLCIKSAFLAGMGVAYEDAAALAEETVREAIEEEATFHVVGPS